MNWIKNVSAFGAICCWNCQCSIWTFLEHNIIFWSMIGIIYCIYFICRSSRPSSYQHSNVASTLPPPSLKKLPDVSHLLASPPLPSNQMIGTNHSSRVAAAMAESASRKRESNGSAFPFPRSKLPRGQLLHSRNIPDTSGGQLIPPQLRGRSV